MSLWTPGGEHEVPREQGQSPTVNTPPAADPDGPPAPASEFDEEKLAEALGIPSLDELSDEEREQLETALTSMAETERQLATTPAEVVVANHAMGIYELAAIHLRQDPPNLEHASLAIDALAAIVDNLSGRLGENEATLVQARSQLQQAYVSISSASPDSNGAADG